MKINEKEVKELQKKYNLSEQEAMILWLEDNEQLENEEVEKLSEKAKINGVGAKASAIDKTKKREIKERKPKISEQKKSLYQSILANLTKNYENNVEILKENKLIQVKIDDKIFKIDIIETRKGKNETKK